LAEFKALTPKQEKFAQLVADGNTQADAYRGAFGQGNQSDKTIIEKASKQMATANVQTRVAQLKEELAKKALWSREESVEALKTVLTNPDKATDIVSAVKELNNMHGYNAPVKMEIEHRGVVNIFVPEQSDDE
jgi:spore germination protein YaaH